MTRTVVETHDFGSNVQPGTDLTQEAFCDPTETLIDCGVQAATRDNGNELDLSSSFYHVGSFRRVVPSAPNGPGCHAQITIDKGTGSQNVVLGVQAFCAAPQ